MNAGMTKKLTLKEVIEAIIALLKIKAPGHDGFPIEFFQEFVNEVTPTLLLAHKAMLAQGEPLNTSIKV
jgi:kynurenine formamidase